MSPELLSLVGDFDILPLDRDLSDAHCPVYVSLKCNLLELCDVEDDDGNNEYTDYKFQWDATKKANFVSHIRDADFGLLNEKLADLEENPQQEKMDDLSEHLKDLFI